MDEPQDDTAQAQQEPQAPKRRKGLVTLLGLWWRSGPRGASTSGAPFSPEKAERAGKPGRAGSPVPGHQPPRHVHRCVPLRKPGRS